MIEAKAFGVGLGRLSAAVRQPLDDLTLEVYFEAMKGLGSTGEWEAYVAWCLGTDQWPEWLPKLGELRESFRQWLYGSRPKPKRLMDGEVPLPEDPQERAAEVRRRFEVGRAAFEAALRSHGMSLNLGESASPREGS